jgi:hypothetical protein
MADGRRFCRDGRDHLPAPADSVRSAAAGCSASCRPRRRSALIPPQRRS